MAAVYRFSGLLSLLALLCFQAQTATAAITAQPRIVGGSAAAEGEWPSTVALYLSLPQSSKYRFCAGTLVAQGWVLTSAHCFFNDDGEQDISVSDIQVLAGTQQLNAFSSGNYRRVQNLIIHPQYSEASQFDYDAALLELSSLESGSLMSLLASDAVANETATVAGWGMTEVDGESGEPVAGSFATVLQQAELKVVDNATCQKTLSYRLSDSMMCAGYLPGGRDSCAGDSGGPLVVTRGGVDHQIGIVSFGDGCGKQGKYGVYTRMTAINHWIEEFTGLPAVKAAGEPRISTLEDSFVTLDSGTNENILPRSGGGSLLWMLFLPVIIRLGYRR